MPLLTLTPRDLKDDTLQIVMQYLLRDMASAEICGKVYQICRLLRGPGVCEADTVLWEKLCRRFGMGIPDRGTSSMPNSHAKFRGLCNQLMELNKYDRFYYFHYLDPEATRSWLKQDSSIPMGWSRELFNHYYNVPRRQGAWYTFTHAAETGMALVVESLTGLGVSPNFPICAQVGYMASTFRGNRRVFPHTMRPIGLAAAENQVETLQFLLSVPGIKLGGEASHAYHRDGQSCDGMIPPALWCACEQSAKRTVDAVSTLLWDPRVNPGERNGNGGLALVRAVQNGGQNALDILRLFLEHPWVSAETLNKQQLCCEERPDLGSTFGEDARFNALHTVCVRWRKNDAAVEMLRAMLADPRIDVSLKTEAENDALTLLVTTAWTAYLDKSQTGDRQVFLSRPLEPQFYEMLALLLDDERVLKIIRKKEAAGVETAMRTAIWLQKSAAKNPAYDGSDIDRIVEMLREKGAKR